jgi:putative transposase
MHGGMPCRGQEDTVCGTSHLYAKPLQDCPRLGRASREAYGAPMIHAELIEEGEGWAMATHTRTELVLDALNLAIGQRRPAAVIHHSDQGCQYTSVGFGRRCQEVGVRPSMGSVGDCYDNAMAESFFATLECEVLGRRRFRSQAEARMAIFDWIEGWYSPRRRHSRLGRISPLNYERRLAVA